MVITINKDNQQLYNEFFMRAHKFARENGIFDLDDPVKDQDTFSSLWQYYSYLPKLGKIDSTYYTKLPLDEPMMKIDGDSREIEVPPQLSKCAGIQNDHMAESIMFIIERYHDGKDLANATIWVQWKAEGAEGKAAVPHKDLNFEKDKIRFPWPLREDVTSHPGTIEFSVVFFMMTEERNVAYRYATLPAKIKISPALIPELGDNAVDTSDGFAITVKKNEYGPGFYIPVNPTFGADQGGLDLENESNLTFSGGDDVSGELTLRAQATVTDTGDIDYVWYHKVPAIDGVRSLIQFECGTGIEKTIKAGTNLNKFEADFINKYNTSGLAVEEGQLANDLTFTYDFGTVGEEEVKLTNNQLVNPFDRYYDNVYKELAFYEDIKNSDKVYFEKFTTLTLPKVESGKKATDKPVTGYYYVKAINIINNNNEALPDNKSEDVYSTTTELISPKNVSIKSTVPETLTFKEDKVTLETELNKNKDESYIVKLYKNETSNIIDMTKSEPLEKEIIFTDEDDITSFELSKDSTNTIGWYQAEITARRNRETKTAVTKTWRIVDQVQAPQIVPIKECYNSKDETEDNLYFFNTTGDVYLAVGFEDGTEIIDIPTYYEDKVVEKLFTDGWTCIWEKITPDSTELLHSSDVSSNYTIKADNWDPKGTDIKCTFRNTLNEEKAETSLIIHLQ